MFKDYLRQLKSKWKPFLIDQKRDFKIFSCRVLLRILKKQNCNCNCEEEFTNVYHFPVLSLRIMLYILSIKTMEERVTFKTHNERVTLDDLMESRGPGEKPLKL